MPISVVELQTLVLDTKNERFLLETGHDDDDGVYAYLKEYEDLDGVIQSIIDLGFFQVVDRPLIITENGHFIVIEGNRRVCALKFLHGLLTEKPDFPIDRALVDSTKSIEVDTWISREAAQPILAMRHMSGIKDWSPESRRKFYAKHYLRGTSIQNIKKMSPESIGEITKKLRQYLFLQSVKTLTGLQIISNPSTIYERVYSLLVEMEIIDPIVIDEQNAGVDPLSYTRKDLGEEETELFIKKFVIATSEQIVHSRSMNRPVDFHRFMNMENNGLPVEFIAIYKEWMRRSSLRHEIPKQMITEFFEGDQSIGFSSLFYVPRRDMEIEVRNRSNEVIDSEPKEFAVGLYSVTIHGHLFNLSVLHKKKPEIHVYDLRKIQINNPIDLRSIFHITDVFGRIVPLPNPKIQLALTPGSIDGTSMFLTSRDKHSLNIYYSYDNTPENTVNEVHEFTPVLPIVTHRSAHEEIVYFEKKFIDLVFTGDVPISEMLISELKTVYKNNLFHVFASALRSVLESALYEVYTESRRTVPAGAFFINFAEFNFERISIDLSKVVCAIPQPGIDARTITAYENTLNAYARNRVQYSEIKNYLEVKLGGNGSQLSQMKATLNLGAHKSLHRIAKQDLDEIRLKVSAFLELMNIIRATGYKL